jgi:cytochrome P450
MADSFDPRKPEIMADPYPVFAEMRARNPVAWSPILRGWLLTRYSDVRAALFDTRLSADRITPFMESLPPARRVALSGLERILTRWAVFVDPPAHTRLRGLMNKAFTPRAIESLQPRIQAIVDRLIDAVVPAGRMDLIADFAYPLPATVIAGMLGVPDSDIERFKSWSDHLAAFVGGAQATPSKYERAAYGLSEMDAYFRAIVRDRRGSKGRDDIIGALVAAEEDGRALSEDELVATAVLILFAGHETTANLIGNGLLALLKHPGEVARLRAQPALAESAVEELLRYDSPAASVTRVAKQNVEYGGRRIAAGDRLFLMINSANRDGEQFLDPNRVDVARTDNRHIAFGYGPHYCIGAPLARLEGQVAFTRLLARLTDIALEDAPLEWSDNLVLRGAKAIPLRFRATA